jgi:hypothetical protein
VARATGGNAECVETCVNEQSVSDLGVCSSKELLYFRPKSLKYSVLNWYGLQSANSPSHDRAELHRH